MPASSLTIKQICDAIDATLGEILVASGDLVRSDNFNELTDGMNDERVLQIYPEEETPVSSGSSGTSKMSLGGNPYIDEEIIIHVDYYAKRRGASLGEDMKQLVSGIDVIRANLKSQVCPPFNLETIRNFYWSWQRAIFDYGGPELRYVGARFRLVLRTY